MSTRQERVERVQWIALTNPWKYWRVKSDDRGRFDEIVIGDVLHAEMMDDNVMFLSVCGRDFTVFEEKGEILMRDNNTDEIITRMKL